MHELSLCRAIADTVRDHSAGRSIERVTVRIGHLRQVVPSTLEFCWGIVTEASDLDGTELVIEHVPAVLACRSCGNGTQLDRPIMRCSACHGIDVELQSGDEFLVSSIDVMEVL
jgi:hydrogenase nickel incorporation protein HypA/HybF